ncbi:ABC transporter ATP-binding protein [Sulfobacillus harzensis]|uniref:ABC transporter ATP-binding protein n=1 Tax=Sulfobacillus harzensis TaxID=2729629 RepID=A0A7Y0L400_9FIRM|nr:ABC transporter ATP-binding protein [Sulfobacillus harzensis]NMP22887.1 ABC transporter ATP-binding protein [Sulfobacillus harzensis]
MSENTPVLEVKDVSIAYESARGSVQAVSHINLSLMPDHILGLVGESGSGKSTLANGIMRLLKGSAHLVGGEILVNGQNVYQMDARTLRQFRWNSMAMVFQSAMTVLNPVMTVEQQMMDVFLSHRKGMSKQEARNRSLELLDMVRIARKHAKSYPHELSGGMKQRIVIAIALALEPSLVIMDEPTTALDVVVQRSILDQIKELQREKHFAVLFISHDFSLVAELASQVAIMYAGRVVEMTESQGLSKHDMHHHPYTSGLMRAIPRLTHEDVEIEGIPGHPPNLVELPSGCAYHPRCPLAQPICREVRPEPIATGGRLIACHAFDPEKRGAFVHVS